MGKYKSPKTFVVTIPTAGTRVPLSATDLFTTSFIVLGDLDNVGRVYVGGDDVDTTNGLPLDAGLGGEYQGDEVSGTTEDLNLANTYVDAENDGDKVVVTYYIRN